MYGAVEKHKREVLPFSSILQFSLLRKVLFSSSFIPVSFASSSSHPFLQLAPYFLAQRTNYSRVLYAVRSRRLIYARLEDFHFCIPSYTYTEACASANLLAFTLFFPAPPIIQSADELKKKLSSSSLSSPSG